MDGIINLAIFLGLIAIGFWAGRRAEKKHYRSIKLRERRFASIPAVTAKSWGMDKPVKDATLVTGSVVVSVDYFKRFLAGLRLFFGGELGAYSSLLDRGRREALLRMKEKVPRADLYLNCRLETSSLSQGSSKKSLGTIEVVAYGTAITFDKPAAEPAI